MRQQKAFSQIPEVLEAKRKPSKKRKANNIM